MWLLIRQNVRTIFKVEEELDQEEIDVCDDKFADTFADTFFGEETPPANCRFAQLTGVKIGMEIGIEIRIDIGIEIGVETKIGLDWQRDLHVGEHARNQSVIAKA